MNGLAESVAYHLSVAGLGSYTPTATTGDVYVDHLPAGPDAVIAVLTLDGFMLHAENAALVNVQVRCRAGAGEHVAARTRIEEIAAHFRQTGWQAGSPRVDLAAGTPAQASVTYIKTGVPAPMGIDDDGRPEWVVTLSIRLAA